MNFVFINFYRHFVLMPMMMMMMLLYYFLLWRPTTSKSNDIFVDHPGICRKVKVYLMFRIYTNSLPCVASVNLSIIELFFIVLFEMSSLCDRFRVVFLEREKKARKSLLLWLRNKTSCRYMADCVRNPQNFYTYD